MQYCIYDWKKKSLTLSILFISILTFTNKSQFEATFLNMPFSVCIYFDTIFSIIVSNWARLSTPVTPWKRSFIFSIFKVALLHIVCYAQPRSFFLQKYLILLVLINMHIYWSWFNIFWKGIGVRKKFHVRMVPKIVEYFCIAILKFSCTFDIHLLHMINEKLKSKVVSG